MNDELTGAYALQSLLRKLKGQNLGEYSVRKEEGSFESRLANVAKGKFTYSSYKVHNFI